MMVDCDTGNGGCNGGMYDRAWQFIQGKGGVMESSAYAYTSGSSGLVSKLIGYWSYKCYAIALIFWFDYSERNHLQVWQHCYWRQGFFFRMDHAIPQPNGFHDLFAEWRTPSQCRQGPRFALQLRVIIIKYDDSIIQFITADSFVLLIWMNSSGVYSDPACVVADENDVAHAVVIVGYGTTTATTTVPATPYWIVRNSWGTGWGLSGYFLIKRGVNMCNIESWTAYVRVV